MPGASNLTGSLKDGEGDAFLLQLCSDTESTEACSYNKGIVPLNPVHFLVSASPKPMNNASKQHGQEEDGGGQRDQSPQQGH